MKPALYHVTWRDAATRIGWIDDPADVALVVNESVGWLVARDATRIALAPSRNAGMFGDAIAIPTGDVVKMRRLK